MVIYHILYANSIAAKRFAKVLVMTIYCRFSEPKTDPPLIATIKLVISFIMYLIGVPACWQWRPNLFNTHYFKHIFKRGITCYNIKIRHSIIFHLQIPLVTPSCSSTPPKTKTLLSTLEKVKKLRYRYSA